MKDKSSDPETLLNFGKHKGKTFIYVYENDSNYVNWAKSIPNPKGELIDFLNFVSNHEMCNNLPIEEKYSSYKQTKNNKYSNNQTFYDNDPSTPKTRNLESNSNYLKSQSSFNISDTSIRRNRHYDDPTPGDVSFFRDADYKEEKLKISPSLRNILDKLEEDFGEQDSDGTIKIDGIIALVLYSEDEFYLSYSKNENNMGWWSPNIPSEISSIVSKLGLTTHNRMLGKTKCVTYKAEDYSTVLKALRSGIQNKNNIEPVPNFVLRTFPEFFSFSRESEVEDKTRQVLEGSQDDYTLSHMDKMQNMIGDILWDKLMPFQRDGVLFGLGRNGRVLIGDEMGLGKTLQALAISAFYIEDWPLLIICPSSIRFQWLEQCLTWLPHLVNENEILMVKTSRHLESCVVNESTQKVSKNKKGKNKNKTTLLDLNYNSFDFENKYKEKSKDNKEVKTEYEDNESNTSTKDTNNNNYYPEDEEEENYFDEAAVDDFGEFNEYSKQNNYYGNKNNIYNNYNNIKREIINFNNINIKKEGKEYKDIKVKKQEGETEDEDMNGERLFKTEKDDKHKKDKKNRNKENKEDNKDNQYELYLGCYKIVIVSYDLLVRMKELDGFKAVICDESHYLKSRSSQRSRRIVPMLKEAKRTVLLSGTPAVNFPAELYQQLSSIIPAFSCYSVFVERYCKKKFNIFSKKMEYTDCKHAHELHLFLIKTVMIRRLKYEVMKELPSKIRSKIPIEVSDKVVKITSMMQDQYKEYVINSLSGETGKIITGKKGIDGKDPQTNLDNFVVKKDIGEDNTEGIGGKNDKINGSLFDDDSSNNWNNSKNIINNNYYPEEEEESTDPDVEAIRREIFDKFGGEWEIKLKRKSKSKRKENKKRKGETGKETQCRKQGDIVPHDDFEDEMNSIDNKQDEIKIPIMPKLFFMTGEAKIKGVCKYIEEILENNNKFIIFAHHIFMLDAIEETLKAKKVTYIRIDGSTNFNARAKMVQDFQRSAKKEEHRYNDIHSCTPDKLKNNDTYDMYNNSNNNKDKDNRYNNNKENIGRKGETDQEECRENKEKEVRVALLSITACGVGLNLTASSTVIFAELYWVPGKLLQAEDRVHRIGTEFRSINIHYLIAQNSIDELIWKVVNNKQMSLTATLDGTMRNIAISGSNKKR